MQIELDKAGHPASEPQDEGQMKIALAWFIAFIVSIATWVYPNFLMDL
jgi:hypothetical protein